MIFTDSLSQYNANMTDLVGTFKNGRRCASLGRIGDHGMENQKGVNEQTGRSSVEAETIAAVATAPGESGIAVVRISGPAALEIADRIFRCRPPRPSARPSHQAVFGRVISADGETLDEALFLPMRAPRSYTGEDVVEIQCHGGLAVPRAVLAAAYAAGARPAEPGEFTRRAFCNGKLDLTQAEAVLDLVRAQSDRTAQLATRQLRGGLRRRVDEIYATAMSAAAEVEAAIEFSEYVDTEQDTMPVLQKIQTTRRMISRLLERERAGAIIRCGIRVAIGGKVNVGKSTLFNALLGRDRAIVSRHPGTTRDIIEEPILCNGIVLRLADTAGIRSPKCEVEAEGIRRATEVLSDSDIVIYVVDASEEVSEIELKYIAELPAEKLVVVANKVDLVPSFKPPEIGFPVLPVSAINGDGISRLMERIIEMASKGNDFDEAYVSERHADLLKKADISLSVAERLVSSGESYHAPAATNIRRSLNYLGEITGQVFHGELLESIFAKFCVGK